MASILDRYGIKQVAEVTFYELDANGNPTVPALYLDTLKVSTIEQTADESTANGGKGNSRLIVWDFNKQINVTLEDALFSAKSLAIMFGNGKVSSYTSYIMKTEQFTATSAVPVASASAAGWSSKYVGPNGLAYTKINPKYYSADGAVVSGSFVKDTTYFCTYDLDVGENGQIIEVSANSFPGTYYVTGDTYARSDASGKDEFFQWIVPKAKVMPENTITMEADGDPTVFNLNLQVLRPKDGVMMKFVKYDLEGGTEQAEAESTFIHNHSLLGTNA